MACARPSAPTLARLLSLTGFMYMACCLRLTSGHAESDAAVAAGAEVGRVAVEAARAARDARGAGPGTATEDAGGAKGNVRAVLAEMWMG